MAHNSRLAVQIDTQALDLMSAAAGRLSGPMSMKNNGTCLCEGSSIHWRALDDQPPELGLIAAMLWRAVCDWIELSPNSKFGHTARSWIKSRSDSPGSYLWACAALSIDPDRIRRFLDTNFEPLVSR